MLWRSTILHCVQAHANSRFSVIQKSESSGSNLDIVASMIIPNLPASTELIGLDLGGTERSLTRAALLQKTSENDMKTQGEIEAAICAGVSRFEQEYMGRGPKHISAHLINDMLVVRLQGVLTAAEQHLVQTLPPEKGRDLLKQVRTQLVETARRALEALVADVTGVKPCSLHHDISTVTGEEIVIFTLTEPPQFRETRKK